MLSSAWRGDTTGDITASDHESLQFLTPVQYAEPMGLPLQCARHLRDKDSALNWMTVISLNYSLCSTTTRQAKIANSDIIIMPAENVSHNPPCTALLFETTPQTVHRLNQKKTLLWIALYTFRQEKLGVSIVLCFCMVTYLGVAIRNR